MTHKYFTGALFILILALTGCQVSDNASDTRQDIAPQTKETTAIEPTAPNTLEENKTLYPLMSKMCLLVNGFKEAELSEYIDQTQTCPHYISDLEAHLRNLKLANFHRTATIRSIICEHKTTLSRTEIGVTCTFAGKTSASQNQESEEQYGKAMAQGTALLGRTHRVQRHKEQQHQEAIIHDIIPICALKHLIKTEQIYFYDSKASKLFSKYVLCSNPYRDINSTDFSFFGFNDDKASSEEENSSEKN